MEQFSERQLYRSCRVLFGAELIISRQFLEYLQLGGIKSAYRKRALETHPDRLIGLTPYRQDADQFLAVREAYETLLSFLETREQRQASVEPGLGTRNTATFRQGPPAGRASRNPGGSNGWQAFRRPVKPIILPEDARQRPVFVELKKYYEGPLPHRPLLFGHFLYYSGLANWRTIARILVWQKAERPRLGELGKQLGMCRQEDVAAILQAKEPFRPFGETALLLGILSQLQVRVLLFHQQRLQKKFGEILVDKNLISEADLQELLCRFDRHNAACYTQ